MQYQQLGRSQLNISRIGLGCMSLSAAKEKESIAIIHHALDLGINYFDTADLYEKGMNEMVVGKALQSKRAASIIATKVGNQWRPDGSGWDWNPDKEYILKCAEASLTRLRTDCIDLYQLHGGTIDDPIDDVIEAFEQLLKQGKIRYYGISSIRPNVIREYVKRSNIVSVMTQYSLADRRPEESILDLLQQNNIGVLSRGALAQGLLVDKPANEYLGYSETEMAGAAQQLQGVAVTTHTAAQAAVQFVLQHPAITSAVVGISRVQQLNEVAATTDKGALTQKNIESLRNALPPKVYEQHR
jgi:aryl-alcohol dehydrogenase-like predicted oxidoreductase